MRILSSSCLFAAMLVAPAAFAQTQPAPAPVPDAAPQPAPAPAEPATVSDDEVVKFVTAVKAVEAVQKDATVAEADKQTKMSSAVQVAGLDPTRFNTIAQAVRGDAALKARVQAEYAKQTKK